MPPDHQALVASAPNVSMQRVNAGSSAAETLTINLPSSVGALNVTIPDTNNTVLPTDYVNILDIVLDNSKINLQDASLDTSQAIVLAEVDAVSGNVVAMSQGTEGNPISLTQAQVSAINAAAVANHEANLQLLENENVVQESDGKDGPILPSMVHKINKDDIVMKDDNGEEIEFEDELEEDVQELVETDLSPVTDKKSTPPEQSKSAVKYKCPDCQRPYVTKAALKKHLHLVHNKELKGQTQKATSKCIHPGCERVFYHRQKMIDHLKEAHGVNCVQEDLVFNSWDEFLLWKEKEEDANFVHFSKNSTHTNAKSYMLTNFTCQREGKAGYKYKGSQQKKYKDLVIGEKICPARMRARLDKPTGRVTVQYCKSHNHKLSFQDFLYRRMPDRLRNEIREKLASGMSSEEVYKELKCSDHLRENRGERFAPSKRQFVTLVNIKTIAKRMQIKETGPAKNFVLEPDPYAIQMQKLVDESYNPVLLYKDQGANVEVGPEEIDHIAGAIDLLLIGIQTKEQREMFVKHGNKVVFIDITEAVISPTQYIVTVKVLDEYNKGYPVAFLISNSRDETVLFYFFRELQQKVTDTDLKVTAVMTENSCNEYYAFRSVFGEEVKHLLCKWNLHRAWCQKIHEECAGDEALQQELYFIFVTMLEEQDVSKFESIATEFVNNYQTRCANFINFFMSNYLSQPEVWASCYRNNPNADCDEILYGDRLHERIKKEIKNNRRVKSVDDLLDLCLKFEHDDYFHRGLNMMLNPPEPQTIISEHTLGMKIKGTSIVENYTADNRWLVKTSKRDPADLQSMKDEEFVVTWKADICEKDFCRERCLKLACFGLCGHLYHCSCESEAVTPCRHIHKVHSMRIGVSQYNNEEEVEEQPQTLTATPDVTVFPDTPLTTGPAPQVTQQADPPKLNLINQVHTTALPDPDRARDVKVKKIKMELVKLYKFLESDNIQKYSLDYIETGLKKVVDECKVIDSIGQSKIMETFQSSGTKRKNPDKDLEEFELLVKSVKKKKVMGTSAPVLVEIEPNPEIYNTFRKRVTGSTEETPEDRMLRLTKSENVVVNIVSDEKYRRTQSQHVTSTPGIIVAREGEDDEDDDRLELLYEPDKKDTEWTPRGARKGKGKGRGRKKSTQSRSGSYPMLDDVQDPLNKNLNNGTHVVNVVQLKALDPELTDAEVIQMRSFIPTYYLGYIPDSIIDSYIHVMATKTNNLCLSLEQMLSLYQQLPRTERLWPETDLVGESKCNFIFVPWRNEQNVVCVFVVDLQNEKINFYDPTTTYEDLPVSIITAHSTIVNLLSTEIPFDNSRAIQPTWPLSNEPCIKEDEYKLITIRALWFVYQIANSFEVCDDPAKMEEFCKVIYETLTGFCINHSLQDRLSHCPVCKQSVEESTINCMRCQQKYHSSCLSSDVHENFICTI